ncbi:nitroreductase [Litorivivens sp.]|uniref:nitroreductase family protein n=2 Tax=Litorivivens sp. TaxID=2020868 RepID=UPI0035681679
MDALTLLKQRNSAAKLTEPGPDAEQLTTLIQAGMRAPDHARLTPWRFLVIEGEARNALGNLFAKALAQRNPEVTEAELEKARSKALRAPLVIAVVTRFVEHPKVPVIEQQLSAGCAAYGILLAAEAMGLAGIWRTGANAFDPNVLKGLGLSAGESLVGYLYIGTREGRAKPLPNYDAEQFVTRWPG